MAPAVTGLPAGVVASSFSIGTYTIGALSDNGGSGNSLRLSRGDVGTSSTSALAGPCLSFSLTIPAGTTLNLSSLGFDFTSGGVTNTEYINARVFSNIDGYDDLNADTIGTLGRVANGADSGAMSVSLSSPDSNPTNGGNSNNGDFDSLTGRTVTFYLPFIRDSQTTATDYLDIDNITLNFVEPTAPTGEISNFAAAASSVSEISLSWVENIGNETGFIIERSLSGLESWSTVTATAANATSFTDSTVVPGNAYTYRIKAALTGGGESAAVISLSVALPSVVKFEFTGGSMIPTLSILPAGVTVSDFSIGSGLGNLFDNNGSPDALRVSGDDTQNTTETALSGSAYLSFSLNIPAGIYINLLSLGVDYQATNAYTRSYAQVFSNVDGFDVPANDAIALVGRTADGTDASVVKAVVNLSSPPSNAGVGSNVSASDFTSLTHRTVTFYLPWIDNSASNIRYTDIDNISLVFKSVPPPAQEITSLTATAISPLEIALTWQESLPDETGFIIERSVTGSGVWETVITTAAGVTSVRDLTMSPGASYTYRISATLSGGGSSPAVLSNSVPVPAASSGPLVIMPMGDSITQGVGAGGGYRSPLYASLSGAGFQMQFIGARSDNTTTILTNAGQTHHEGHGSYSTDLLLGNLDASTPYGGTNEGGFWITGISGTRAPAYPDLFLLMIGTNDIGMWAHTPAEAINYYDQLLTKLVTLRPSARIICASIVPFVLSEFEEAYPAKVGVYTNREPKNVIFNSMLPDLVAAHQAVGHRVQFYDMRQKVSPANALTLIGGDGVHPNQAGYNAIASGWFDAMKQLPLNASWRILHFGSATASQAADSADPDGDGDTNLVEYAFGTDPMSAGARPVTGATLTESGVDHLSVTFPRRKHADVRYLVEVSSDLSPGSWSADTVQSGAPVGVDADFEQVTFRDRQPAAASDKRFIRVRIVKP
jgi:lysophospholipase L1-like esterase